MQMMRQALSGAFWAVALALAAPLAAQQAGGQQAGGQQAGGQQAGVAPAAVQTVAVTPPEPDPSRGAVTNLPLPRYVTLKTKDGVARRGPGLTHRIDWVFTRPGMPLKVTAEYENWRRVEDAEGAGGWVHYALLSGVRSVLIMQDMTELKASPDPRAAPVLLAEYGVVARLVECNADWCRLSIDGTRGWAPRAALWGVDPGEVVD